MVVEKGLFGSIYSGYPQDKHFLSVLDKLGSYISRWPGGTLAETRSDVYDIGADEIFDATNLFSYNPGRTRLSLAEAFQYSENQHLSVVVPTYRYLQDLETAEADLSTFISNIDQDSSLFGTTIRLEIGNEFYSFGDFEAGSYGSLANHLVSVISGFSPTNIDLEVVVQMGRTVSENAQIVEQFVPESLVRIDALSFHALPINLTNLYQSKPDGIATERFASVGLNIEAWRTAVMAAGGDRPDLFMSAWTVGSAATSADEVDLEFQDIGARGGTTTLALLGEAARVGVDEASAWGVGVTNLNSLGYIKNEVVQLTHSGMVFKELQNSVVGLEFSELSSEFKWDQAFIQSGVQFYTGNGRMVMYFANGDEPVSSTQYILDKAVAFDLSTASVVEALRIETEYEDGHTPVGSVDDRLFERPIVVDLIATGQAPNLDSPYISFVHAEHFQITEVTVSWRHYGSAVNDVIDGTIYDDDFDGQAGDDVLDGLAGHDTLFGDAGQDTLLGGEGDDRMYGGSGSDILYGGAGNDLLIGGGMDEFLMVNFLPDIALEDSFLYF